MNVQILERTPNGSLKNFNSNYESLSAMMSAHHATPPNFVSRMYYREVIIIIEPNDFGYWENWVNMPAFSKYSYNHSQNSMKFGAKLHELIRNNLRSGDNLTINVNTISTNGSAVAFPEKYIKDNGSILETFDFREYNINFFAFMNNSSKLMYTFDHHSGYRVNKGTFKRLTYDNLPFKLNNTNNASVII